MKTIYLFVCLTFFSWSLAQEFLSLEVKETEKHLFALRLQGEWKLQKTMTARLNSRKYSLETISFESDATVAQKIPQKYAPHLQEKNIYLAGILVAKQKKAPFLLTEKEGSPYLVYFRERGGDPLGDAESFYLSLIPAQDMQHDLLFIGGDFSNDPFCVFERAIAVVNSDLSTVLKEAQTFIDAMIATIESGKDLEFLETYADPEEIKNIKIANRFDQVLDDFKNGKNKELLEILKKLNSLTPEISEDNQLLIYQSPDFHRKLKLKKINNRWYLLN